MRAKIANLRRRWNKAKLTKSAAFWVAIGAIILAIFLGFTQAGWVTGGAALQMAERTSRDAVTERLAPICVAQFNQDPQKDQKLEELKGLTSSYQRTKYVKDQGWATMPGEMRPDDAAAAECARQLMLVGE